MSDGLARLPELERRLEREPENLSLRVTVAGLLSEVGRATEAVELYRSVALAYRDQGRTQQAIAVCRSMLELAADDATIHALLRELQPERVAHKPRPVVPRPAGAKTPSRPPAVRSPTTPPADRVAGIPRRTSIEPHGSRASDVETPLPRPVPYHVADPSVSAPRVRVDEDVPTSPSDDTRPGGAEDLSVELDTRQVPRLSAADLAKVSQPPPTVPIELVDEDQLPTPLPPQAQRPWRPSGVPIRDTPIDPPTDPNLDPATDIGDDDELTAPRELVAADPMSNAFFVALPANRRDLARSRCTRRDVRAGTMVIRQGETSHPLILVVAGKLELRVERPNGTLAIVDTIDPGQFIGEAALLGRTPAAANVIAMIDSELLALPPHALFELAGAYPALWAALKDTAERRTRQYERVIRASP